MHISTTSKVLLAITACSLFVIINGANARRYERRWIQSTGFGGSEPQYKRQADGNAPGEGRPPVATGFQGDNGLFPKFPGDEVDEFEQEVQGQSQEQDKDKLEQEQPSSPPILEVGGESVIPDADVETGSSGSPGGQSGQETGGQVAENHGFEGVGQEQQAGMVEKSGETIGNGAYSEKDNGEFDSTTEVQPHKHKPWYKKVHGFFKNQYDYLKERIGRGDDYYVNQ